jgi:hypothetical protein
MLCHGERSVIPSDGTRVELARYTVRDGERVLYGQSIEGIVWVSDCPASGPGRCYPVDHCAKREGLAAVKALVADYVRQAARLDAIPMLGGFVSRIDEFPLARYTFTGGERVLYGQRVNGAVRVTDRPARGPERSYLVECGLECDGYSAFEALIADYLCQAWRLDEIPMTAGPVRRFVEQEARV